MESKNLTLGQKVRYHKDGRIYSISKIYDIEVAAGCHSFDMTVVDLDGDTGNEYKIHPSDISPAEISKSELDSYVNTNPLSADMRKWMDDYKRKTGDEIIDIQWDYLTKDKIRITSKRLGTKEFNFNWF